MWQQRLRRAWQLRFFVPLSPLGAVVLVAALAVHRYIAVVEVDFVLHAASLAAVGLVASAVTAVVVASLLVWLRLRRRATDPAELELETGGRAATGAVLPRLRGWPLVSLEVSWVEPPDVAVTLEPARRGATEVVLPRRRGRSLFLERRFLVGDIFGLARFGLLRRTPRRVRILPARARLVGQVVTHVVGGDALSHPEGPVGGELLDMRRYAPGDPLRYVLWKAYARTRQLLVRTPERAIAPSPAGTGYLVAGPGDEPSASAARFFIEEGLLGKEFVFGADGSAEPTADAEEALEQIITSAAFRHRGAEGLARFIERVPAHRRRSCMLFLPARAGPWVERLERVAARLAGATAIIGVDWEVGRGAAHWAARVLFARSDRAERQAAARLPALVARLGRAGFALKVVHRPTGQLIPVPLLEELAREVHS